MFISTRLRVATTLAALGVSLGLGPAARADNCSEPGCDPSEIAVWANEVDSLVRGLVDIAMPELGTVTHGDPLDIPGPPTGIPTDAVSLGDGGSVTLHFSTPFRDGPDFDLAVFENGISSGGGLLYMELGYVEVSSNGIDFARFDSLTSRTTPVFPLEEADPDDYAHLAGHREAGLGSEFDLSDLSAHPLVLAGHVDLQAIEYVRIIDVIGDGSTFDAMGSPLYDPYPTRFGTGGFDLDAVGALHVPEPGAFASGLLGAVFLACAVRRRV